MANLDIRATAEQIEKIIKKSQHTEADYAEFGQLLQDYIRQDVNDKNYLYGVIGFAKGRLNELAQYPDLVSSIAHHSVRRMERVDADSIGIIEDFKAHKDTATIIYAHIIKDKPRINYDLRRFIHREMFLDLFGNGPRTKSIQKNLRTLGIYNAEMDDYESFLLKDMHYLMKNHDLEMSALIHDSNDMMDVVMCSGEWKRNDIIGTLLRDLDKVTLNEKQFPKMAKLIVDLIDNNIGGSYEHKMNEQYKEAILCITKMAAKPGYQRSGVLFDQESQLVEDHPEALTLESALYSAIATDFSDNVVNAIKQSPIKIEMEQAGERTLLAAIKRMSSTKVAPYRLVQAFDLAIRDEKLTRLKRDSLARDFNI